MTKDSNISEESTEALEKSKVKKSLEKETSNKTVDLPSQPPKHKFYRG